MSPAAAFPNLRQRVAITLMRVAIFNVKYSPNLGDGVIAECLEHEIERRSGWAVQSIDLAGRLRWEDPGLGRSRAVLLPLLRRMPPSLREAVVSLGLGREMERRLRPQWRATLQGVDFVIFGGGQIFQDGDLNFPIKLAAAATECDEKALAFAVFGVGVAPSRSARGHRLLARLTRSPNLVYASVRDPESRAAMSALGPAADLCRDPGLLAASVWPAPRSEPRERPLVGLGITHPAVLAYHAANPPRLSSREAIARYAACAGSLVGAGFDVVCFTNGAGEDEKLLAAVQSRLRTEGGAVENVSFASRRESPGALARLIADCDAVVAHRLHACILAYAYRVPAVGLRWDDKLQAFFDSVARGSHAVAFDDWNARRLGSLVTAALKEGIEPALHAHVVKEASQSVARLLEVISIRIPAAARAGRPQAQPRHAVGQEPGGTREAAFTAERGAA